MIVDLITVKAIGTIGFKGLEPDQSAEVGYKIVKSCEGKGYMSSALNLLSKWAYDQKICLSITASKVPIGNIGSQRVLDKIGFEKVRSSPTEIDFELRLE
ncbi:MAG: GNAT family N-acetyltransferase [Clostridiales bacterium]|nr:GNAT family N-acetyltransferase [Clostridiales bacterium]